MKNLDARAKAIIEAARDGDHPTQSDRDRIRHQVALHIAAGTVAASTVAVAGTMSATAKVGLVVATVAVVGGGSIGVARVWHAHPARLENGPAHVAHTSAGTPTRKTQSVAMAAPASAERAVPPPLPALAAQGTRDNHQAHNEKMSRRSSPAGADSERLAPIASRFGPGTANVPFPQQERGVGPSPPEWEADSAPAVSSGASGAPSRAFRPTSGTFQMRSERPSPEDSLNAEVDLLAQAREELRLGKPRRALDTLAEYDRRFASGALGEEKRAIAAIATCQAEPGPAARAQAQAFIRSAPSSPLAERVRQTCVTAAPVQR